MVADRHKRKGALIAQLEHLFQSKACFIVATQCTLKEFFINTENSLFVEPTDATSHFPFFSTFYSPFLSATLSRVMRIIATLLIALIAAASALHEFCGTAKCPFEPTDISCNGDVCFTNSVIESSDSNSIYFTTDSRFTQWTTIASPIPLRVVREIYAFSNGAVLVGGFNEGKTPGLYYSPDGQQEFVPLGTFPKIGSLRRVRPPTANNEAYVLGITTGMRFEQVGAIAVTPEGKTQTWDFPFGFVVHYGHPHVLHSVKEGIWLAATERPHPDTPSSTLFRSTDYGKTWTDVAKTNVKFFDVTCCPGGGLCAAVGATDDEGVVYVSNDGGMNFKHSFSVPITHPSMTIPRVRVTHKTETIVVTTCSGVSADNCTGTAYYSRDAGATWTAVEAPIGSDLRGMEAGPDGESVFIAGRNSKRFGTFSVIQFNETQA